MEPPPTRRVAEVSDIAESIINSLLPDEWDERREIINEGYQLGRTLRPSRGSLANRSSPKMTNRSR
jgi:hypothetical protein